MNRYLEFLKLSLEEIFSAIHFKLMNVGCNVDQANQLIKDVINSLELSKEFSIIDVNEKLKKIGWSDNLVDEETFELIIVFLEKNNVCNLEITSIN